MLFVNWDESLHSLLYISIILSDISNALELLESNIIVEVEFS